jgi:hypothetical protein
MNPTPDFPADVAPRQTSTPEPTPALGAILDYLEHQLPSCRFDGRLDPLLVRELLEDFPDMDILEEIKNLRWYHDHQPLPGGKTQRITLRRSRSQSRALRLLLIPLPGDQTDVIPGVEP